MEEVNIRKPAKSEDMSNFVGLMKDAFRIDSHSSALPKHTFKSFWSTNSLLGAYIDNELVGSVCFWPDVEKSDRIFIYATSVDPNYQNRRVGELLMSEIEKRAIEREYSSLYGTIEPLSGKIAQMYVSKFGVTVDEYVRDYYGNLEAQEAEFSIPTDRFIAEKFLDESELSYSYDSIQTVISVDGDGHPESTNESVSLTKRDSEWVFKYHGSSRVLGIEIPRKFESLPDDVGSAWRYATRQAFESLLTSNGGRYTLVDFISQDSNGVKENTYVLLRDVR